MLFHIYGPFRKYIFHMLSNFLFLLIKKKLSFLSRLRTFRLLRSLTHRQGTRIIHGFPRHRSPPSNQVLSILLSLHVLPHRYWDGRSLRAHVAREWRQFRVASRWGHDVQHVALETHQRRFDGSFKHAICGKAFSFVLWTPKGPEKSCPNLDSNGKSWWPMTIFFWGTCLDNWFRLLVINNLK